jgi:hypothetical protein
MATVNLGSIKFKWKGTYAGGTAYTVDDVVSYNGSSYICILASTGNLPTNATYFEQMSQAGTNGTDLTTTLTTQGDLVYRDGSGLVRLGAGTAGQALITNGAGANPSWGTAGKVLQLLSTTKTDTQANSSQSMVAITGLTVTITPRDINSTFYLIANVNLGASTTNVDAHLQFTRNGTSVIIADTAGSRSRDTWNGGDDAIRSVYNSLGIPITGLDTPATTSAITYGIKYGALESTQTIYINRTGQDGDAPRDGRGTSTITVMEIAG